MLWRPTDLVVRSSLQWVSKQCMWCTQTHPAYNWTSRIPNGTLEMLQVQIGTNVEGKTLSSPYMLVGTI